MKMFLKYAEKYNLFNNIPAGVIIIDEGFTILFWNKKVEVWSSRPRIDVIGANLKNLYPHLRKPEYTGRLSTIFDYGPPVLFSPQLHGSFVTSYLPNGKSRILQTTVFSEKSLTDRSYNALIVLQDISELTNQLDNYIKMRKKHYPNLKSEKKQKKKKIN